MAKKDADESSEPRKEKKGGKRKLIVGLVVLAVAAAGTYVFVLGGGKSQAAEPTGPQPGVIVKLDPINLNLADGHYLKLGLALQATKGAKAEELDGARTLDEAITVFTSRKMSELGNAAARDKLKAQLVAKVQRIYEGNVMDVYFTEFVMQ